MTKFNKIFFYIITIVIIIPILLILALITIVDPNNYKSTITSLVSSNINREVTIDGNLNWNLFPFGITINKLKVENDPKFKSDAQYMIESDNATVSLKLFPLIFKQYELRTLLLDNTTINLAIDSTGYTNWQSLSQTNKNNSPINKNISYQLSDNSFTVASAGQTPYRIYSSQIVGASQGPSFDLSVNKLKITNSTVNFLQNKEKIVFNKVNINGKNINLDGSPFDLDGSFNANIKSKNLLLSNKFETKITILDTQSKYIADIKKLKINIGDDTTPSIYNLVISTLADIDLNSEKVQLKPLNIDINGNNIMSSVVITNFYTTPMYDASFEAKDIYVGKMQKIGQYISGKSNFTFTGKSKGKDLEQIMANINGNAKFNLASGSIKGINLDKLLKLLSSKITINPKDILNTLDSTLSFIEGLVETVTGNNQNTNLISASATGVFNNGVLTNNDLNLTTQATLIAGAGKINLPKESISYELHLYDRENKENLDLPIIISGSLYDPSYDVKMPSGNLIKNNMKVLTDTIKVIPGIKELPVEKLEKLLNF
jgi:uncharacterized protein involved in outer membrane biogenesis